MSKFDLILHPVRMRILINLVGQQMTPQQLAQALPDVAQATLYRHINTLAEGGILTVVAENPVRGTVEKVYTVEQQAAHLTPEDIADLSADDHVRLFTTFVTTLLHDFSSYIESHAAPDFAADGVGYHTTALYLDDEELLEFATALGKLMQPYLTPNPERQRRLFSTVFMPAVKGG